MHSPREVPSLLSSNEAIKHDGNHAIEVQEFYETYEDFDDPVVRRDYFGHLDSVGFIDLTQQVASLLRTGDSNTRYAFDGNRVDLPSHEIPDQRDKGKLLRETWETARSFLVDSNLSDEDALTYAALTTAGGFLYTHAFRDANGRESRIFPIL